MAKPIWIFEFGMYRTGSTSHYLLIEGIIEELGLGQGIGYHTDERLNTYERYNGQFVVCKVFRPVCEESQTGKVIKQEGRVRAIGTIRDPRDIVASMKKRGVNFSWENTMEEWPKWMGWFLKWCSYGPDVTRVAKYEDFTKDPVREALEIAKFLNIRLNLKQAQNVAQRATLEYQKELNEKAKEENRSAHPWLPSIPGPAFGKSKNWPEVLTAQEKRDIEGKARHIIAKWRY